MMKPYVIEQGDHLRKLAFRMGFEADAIWNDPTNAALREKRKPNLLHPGDVLNVPDVPRTSLSFDVGTKNHYVARLPHAQVHLVFSNANGPMADEPYAILGFAAPDGTTGKDGSLTLSVPVNLREFYIHFTRRNVGHAVRVGDMDPIEEDSGVDKRLQHLGHLSHPPYWTPRSNVLERFGHSRHQSDCPRPGLPTRTHGMPSLANTGANSEQSHGRSTVCARR